MGYNKHNDTNMKLRKFQNPCGSITNSSWKGPEGDYLNVIT